jgi:murein DD-endopeptidase MepM/ murein hydrolase activator NlpD
MTETIPASANGLASLHLAYPLAEPFPISQPFGAHPLDYARFEQAGHNGVDFACPTGQPVLAAAPGKVIRAGTDPSGYGLYVLAEHFLYGMRIHTLYAHLNRLNVHPGQGLRGGQSVGLSGNTGNSTGPHLHFELRTPDQPNPGYPQNARDPLPALASDPALEENSGQATVRAVTLNLRAAPGLQHPVLAQLLPDCPVESGELRDGWLQVRLQGWVKAEYVSRAGGL